MKTENSEMVTLATFDTPTQSEPLVELLKDAGFEASVLDEGKAQSMWFLARRKASVHVMVAEPAAAAARILIEANPAVAGTRSPSIKCPSCGSSRVQYPQMTRKNVLPTVVAHVLVALKFMEHEHYCEDCHYTWTRKAHSEVTSGI